MLCHPRIAYRTDIESTAPETSAVDEHRDNRGYNDQRQDDPTHAKLSTFAYSSGLRQQRRTFSKGSWPDGKVTD